MKVTLLINALKSSKAYGIMLLFCFNFILVHGATRYVDASYTGVVSTGTQAKPYKKIQDAINATTTISGVDIIQVKNGTYNENVIVNKNLTITNFNGHNPIIQGLGTESVVFLNGVTNTVLEGFTIRGGIGTMQMAPWGWAVRFGGGVLVHNSTNCTLRRLIVESCQASHGGGITLLTSNNNFLDKLTIRNCKADGGGGLCIISNNVFNTTLRNSLIASCSATIGGGGIDWDYSTKGSIEHVTISQCSIGSSGLGGAAIYRANAARFDAKNLIIWNNTPAISGLLWGGGTPTAPSTITHSIIESSSNPAFPANNIDLNLTNCIDTDPLFLNLTDFHLQSNVSTGLGVISPAINKGTTATASDDLDGNCRLVNGVNDMGAYEMCMPAINTTQAKVGTANQYTLKWSAESCATKYQIEYRNRVNSTSPWSATTNVNVNAPNTSRVINTIKNREYQWRIRTFCKVGTSDWSDWMSNTFIALLVRPNGGAATTFATKGNLEPLDDVFGVFPNPAHDFITVRHDFKGYSNAQFEITNLMGQKVAQFEVTLEESRFDVSKLQKGMYVYRLMIDGENMETGKLMIQK